MNKVLILTEFFPPNNSGVSQSVKRLFDLLQHHHHSNISVAVIEPLTDAYYYPQFWDERINNITIWHINVGKNRPLSTPEDIRVSEYMLKEIVLTNSIDIIHAYNIFNAGYIAYRLYVQCNIPYILSIRGNDLTRRLYNYPDLFAQTLIINNARIITCVNGFLQKCLIQNFPDVIDKTRVIYNSILPEKSWMDYLSKRGELRKEYNVNNKFVFAYIGEVKEKKQTMMLIDAFMQFNKQYKDTKLYIVGYVYQEEQSLLSKLLKLCADIVYVPKVTHEEVGKFFAIADAFVQISYDDGLPNTLLEAMYMQVPIVTSSIFSDFLSNGQTALLTNPFSKKELLNNLSMVYLDSHLRKKLVFSSQKLIQDILSTQKEYLSYIATYEEIQ